MVLFGVLLFVVGGASSGVCRVMFVVCGVWCVVCCALCVVGCVSCV